MSSSKVQDDGDRNDWILRTNTMASHQNSMAILGLRDLHGNDTGGGSGALVRGLIRESSY